MIVFVGKCVFLGGKKRKERRKKKMTIYKEKHEEFVSNLSGSSLKYINILSISLSLITLITFNNFSLFFSFIILHVLLIPFNIIFITQLTQFKVIILLFYYYILIFF